MADPQNKRQEEEKSILIQEKRTLKFWFKDETPKEINKTKNAYDFFLELVNPDAFPKGEIQRGWDSGMVRWWDGEMVRWFSNGNGEMVR